MNRKFLLSLQKRNKKRLQEIRSKIEGGNVEETELDELEKEATEIAEEQKEVADKLADLESNPEQEESRGEPNQEVVDAETEPTPEPEQRSAGMIPIERRNALNGIIAEGIEYRGQQSQRVLETEVRSAFANFVVGRISEQEARSVGLEVGNGSVTVPEVIASEVITYAQEMNPLRRLGEVVLTEGDVKYPFLIKKMTANVSKKERTTDMPETDTEFDEIVLDPAEFDALATVTKKLIKMSRAPIEKIVIDELKKAYVRKEANYMFNGDDVGNENPGALAKKAIAFTPEVAVDLTAANAGALMYDALIDLKNAPVTEVMNKGRFLINRAALRVIEKMKDSNGTPLIRPASQVEGGIGSLLVGYTYEVTDYADKKDSPDVPVFYFGDFYSFKIQDVIGGMEIQRLVEQYAKKNRVGFQIYNLLDGQLIYSPLEPTVYRFELAK